MLLLCHKMYFYPRPPQGGRRLQERRMESTTTISIHALRKEGDKYPPGRCIEDRQFLSTPSARRATVPAGTVHRGQTISIHALRKEGDFRRDGVFLSYWQFLSTPSARRATADSIPVPAHQYHFYPRPPQGGRLLLIASTGIRRGISIHALRKEGDSKNGEKHLRFCFIIKRSAQIWKSLSKNIRKNSCDLHKTA